MTQVVDIAKAHGADINTHLVGQYNCFVSEKRGLFQPCETCLLRFMCITGSTREEIIKVRDDLIAEAHHLDNYKDI